MVFKFNFKYFLIFLLLFGVEVMIATIFSKVYFIRAFLGDILVVILLYAFILSFVLIRNKLILLLGIFLFSIFVEVAQYFKIADVLGFEKGSFLYIVVGNYFSWGDIICYAVGCILIGIMNKMQSFFNSF